MTVKELAIDYSTSENVIRRLAKQGVITIERIYDEGYWSSYKQDVQRRRYRENIDPDEVAEKDELIATAVYNSMKHRQARA